MTLPQITQGEVPSAAIAKLEQSLGIDLPDDYGQIAVYDSQDLEALQQALYTFERLLVFLLILIPLLVAASLLVSTRAAPNADPARDRGGGGLVVRRIAIILRDDLFDKVTRSGSPRCAFSRTS